MSLENERAVEAIHYYPKQKRVIVEVDQGPAFSLTQTPEGLFYQLLSARSITQQAEETLLAQAPTEGTTDPDPDPALGHKRLLTGKLKTQPKEGRADKHGQPTAWARLAAHDGEAEQALMLSATFHRATRRIALSLHLDDQITVEGYYKPNPDPQRMDFLNVFRFLHYPGRPQKTGQD